MKLTLGESAYLTELSKEGVRKYIADGRLKAEKRGNKYIVDSNDLEQVLILKRPLSSIKGYTLPENEVESQDLPFSQTSLMEAQTKLENAIAMKEAAIGFKILAEKFQTA